MKLKKSTAILILIALSTSWVAAQVPRGPQGVKANTINLNKAAFDQSLSNAVGPKVMGYQYVLIKMDGWLLKKPAVSRKLQKTMVH